MRTGWWQWRRQRRWWRRRQIFGWPLTRSNTTPLKNRRSCDHSEGLVRSVAQDDHSEAPLVSVAQITVGHARNPTVASTTIAMRQSKVPLREWNLVGLALASLSVLFASCSTSTPTEIALFGDSLSWEAQPYYDELLHAGNDIAHVYDSHGGTAICDWFTRMHEVESQYHPKSVELEFSGNNLTPCMEGLELYSQPYYEKYRVDTLTAIDIFVSGGAHVYLIGAPITRAQQSVPNWQTLNSQYAKVASADPRHVTYLDAGTAVEGPAHAYTDTLPCLTHEPCSGLIVNGIASNVVRSADGVHFCPTEEGNDAGVIGGCPVYSSGAYRYAKAMADPLAPRR